MVAGLQMVIMGVGQILTGYGWDARLAIAWN